ncbi:hypothetical protein SAMN04488564_116162 [Lentzea waywayandensis]|uniref:Uncharacterized protein n=1 Tax=Lentzea waywayandensis TaxID=84724 RepID=A0A1I6FGL9_9PSEU|nr:hypothetical protein [Lentzea waywayandensis]SFR29054.1 hypothetical protein SAMN04488564_116162 [Lentzea waywayandensis]
MIIDEPPAPRKSLGTRVLTYGLTLVAAAVAIYGMTEFLAPITAPKTGECANVTGYSNEPDLDSVNCTSSSANYVVTESVSKSKSCANAYTDMITRRAQDPEIRICLVPLWEEGACYPTGSSRMELTPVECGADAFKVTKAVRDVPGPSCAAGEQRYSYPEVKLTYCAADQ